MADKTYRDRLLADIAKARTAMNRSQATEVGDREVAFDKSRPSGERTKAIFNLAMSVGTSKAVIMKVIGVLRDDQEPMPVRFAALNSLKVAAFASRTASSWGPSFRAALRKISNGEPGDLFTAAVDTLAHNGDGNAFHIAESGLRRPRSAKLKPYDAVRILSYDDHGSHFDIMRKLAVKNRSLHVREAAIHILASDPGSKDLLVDLVKDSRQPVRIRQAALLALRALSPDDYRDQSAVIVGDESEHENLRASAITAMRVDSNTSDEMGQRIEKLTRDSKSALVRHAANLYTKDA